MAGQPTAADNMPHSIDVKLADMEANFSKLLSAANIEMEEKIKQAVDSKQESPPSMDELKSSWEAKLGEIRKYIETEINALKEALREEITTLRVAFQEEMKPLIQKLEEQEQYSRRNCLIIHGIPESDRENTTKLAIYTIDNHLQLNFKLSHMDIDRSHR